MPGTSSEASRVIASRAGDASLARRRRLFARLAKAAVTISTWTERVRQRRALGQLDDRLLRDIGVTRVKMWQEISKPFWKA